MHIAEIETFCLKIAHRESYLGVLPDGSEVPDGYSVRPPWRSLYSSRFETILVKITASDGTAGWGEALAPVAPEVLATIINSMIAPRLRGVEVQSPRLAWLRLTALMRERGHLVGHQADAQSAVDIALWDLAAKIRGISVVDMLGGAQRNTVPTYVSGLPGANNEERANLAFEWSNQGVRSVKLHLGHGVDDDIATVEAVQEAAPGLRIAVDAHWAYTVHEARRLSDELATRGVWFLEAPLVPEDELSHQELVRFSRIPVAVGETLRNRYEFERWTSRRALDIAQPDVGRTGLTEAVSVAEVCAARHLGIAPHHSVGLGVLLAAGIQLSAAVPNLIAFEYQPMSTEVGSGILRSPLEHSPQGFSVPQSPGLGIEVDEEFVRRIAIEETP